MKKIEKNIYTGYLWYSNSKTPQIFVEEEFEATLNDDILPFVVEGRLWCKNNNTSISISYIDGSYIIDAVEVNQNIQNGTATATVELYIPHHRIMPLMADKGLKDTQLKFLRFWDEINDPLCEDYCVLEPGKLVFVGFANKKEE